MGKGVIPLSTLKKVEAILGARALATPEQLDSYGRDESGLGVFPPEVVALVESRAEVIEIMKLAALDKIPITPRGAGTGMTGGALPIRGGIVLSTERLKRVVDIDEKSLTAVVEPGVITGEFQTLVESQGLFYPPDPASLSMCSLGGNVAENAGGPRAFKYGVTREYVLGLDLTLIGGQNFWAGRRTVKGVTGFDVVALVVGSEGTLGLISEITLKLLPKPAQVVTFLAHFPSVRHAAEGVTAMIRQGFRPRTLELIDVHTVDHLRLKGDWPIPPAPCAFLLVELDGEGPGLDETLQSAAAICERVGANEISVATDETRRRQLWDMRRRCSPTLRALHRHKYSEDIVVPRAQIPEMLRRLDQLAAQEHVTIASFGHAGDGNLHVNVLFDEDTLYANLERILHAIFRHTIELGGTLSGEHGIGLAKQKYMPLEQSAELLDLQRNLKRTFDPQNLLNPGKIFP